MTSVKVSKYLPTYLACNCNLPNQICIFSNFEASILEVVELIQAWGQLIKWAYGYVIVRRCPCV